jgi:hypothetical protein
MAHHARGTFEIEMRPGTVELGDAVRRLDFTKRFHGELDAVGAGVLLSGGDPGTGEAGYVAIETVTGRLDDRRGGFALQQLGMMHAGTQTLQYQVVPGSGSDALEGITGTFHLTVEDDGTHRYDLEYQL